MFKGTRFLHIGMDEEHMPDYQKYNTMLIVRQGDLWWHDALWLVKEVEKHGVRAWMWHDYLRKGKIADFEKRMPKSVVQSPWTYQIENTTRYENLLWTFKALADAGYDTIPCSSHRGATGVRTRALTGPGPSRYAAQRTSTAQSSRTLTLC